MSSDQQTSIVWAARGEIDAIRTRLQSKQTSPVEAQAELDAALAARAALVAAARDETVRQAASPELRVLTPAQITAIAYDPRPLEVIERRQLAGGLDKEALINRILERYNQVQMRRGYTPVNEPPTGVPPLNPSNGSLPGQRLPDAIDRPALKGVVGVGKRTAAGLEFHCSGVALSATVIITAQHCVSGANGPGPFVVLSVFTGGTETAVRKGDGRSFPNLRAHDVTTVHPRHNQFTAASDPPWPYDIAVIEIAGPGIPADQATFPRRSTAFQSPPIMTGAGWGSTDMTALNGVPLEAARISVPQSEFKPAPPTSRYWPQGIAKGGVFCPGDSGGPLFDGAPDGQGKISYVLVGLVSAGFDCTHAVQIITDLTVPETRSYICGIATGARFCTTG